jgi:hypothetical protein
MKKPPPLALFATGKVADFGILKLGPVREQLGPVRASSLRVASRMVNQMRAGRAVSGFEELAECPVVLVCVPPSKLKSAVDELACSGLDWRHKTVLLCNDWSGGASAEPLERLGASVGALLEVASEARPLYLLDGDGRALREARKLVSRRNAILIPLAPGSKPFLLAAMHCTGPLLYASLRVASGCLRKTGLPAPLTTALLQRAFSRTLRSHQHSGPKAPGDFRNVRPPGGVLEHLDAQTVAYLEASAAAAGMVVE